MGMPNLYGDILSDEHTHVARVVGTGVTLSGGVSSVKTAALSVAPVSGGALAKGEALPVVVARLDFGGGCSGSRGSSGDSTGARVHSGGDSSSGGSGGSAVAHIITPITSAEGWAEHGTSWALHEVGEAIGAPH